MKHRVAQVVCPVCNAPKGSNCNLIASEDSFFHAERYTAADVAFGRKIALPGKGPRKKLVGISDNCHKENHDKCSGVVRKNHGVKSNCTCSCHQGLANAKGQAIHNQVNNNC
jgi:hypothetical protein